MARGKNQTISVPANATATTIGVGGTGPLPPLDDGAYPVDAERIQVDIAPVAIDTPPAPVRTQDRDPAHRHAWKRERAIALGYAKP